MPAKLYYLYRCRACDKLFTSKQSFDAGIVAMHVSFVNANYNPIHECNEKQVGIADLVGHSTIRIEH